LSRWWGRLDGGGEAAGRVLGGAGGGRRNQEVWVAKPKGGWAKICSGNGGRGGGWLFLGREHKPGVGGCVPVRGRVGGRPGRWIRPPVMELGVGVGKRVEPGVPRLIRVLGDCVGNVAKRREVLAGVRD